MLAMHLLTDVPDIQNYLFPNLTTLVSHIIATLLILLVLARYAWKPFQATIKARTDYINNNIRSSEELKVRATELARQNEQLLSESQKTAKDIIEQAQIEALQQRETLVRETEAKIADMKDAAFVEIKRERMHLQETVKSNIVEISVKLSEKILSQKISKEEHQELIHAFLKNVDKEMDEQSQNRN